MIEGAAVAAAGRVPPAVMVGLTKAELREACAAKYHGAGLAHYAALGISSRQIKSESVAELAEADMAAENRRVQRELPPQTPLAITVKQFVVSAPAMAKRGALVSIAGAYVRLGRMEYLYGSQYDVEMENSPDPGYIPRVPLLTDNAPEDARSTLLDCAEQPGSSETGCLMTVVGIVTICTETSVYGAAVQTPCLDVHGVSSSN